MNNDINKNIMTFEESKIQMMKKGGAFIFITCLFTLIISPLSLVLSIPFLLLFMPFRAFTTLRWVINVCVIILYIFVLWSLLAHLLVYLFPKVFTNIFHDSIKSLWMYNYFYNTYLSLPGLLKNLKNQGESISIIGLYFLNTTTYLSDYYNTAGEFRARLIFILVFHTAPFFMLPYYIGFVARKLDPKNKLFAHKKEDKKAIFTALNGVDSAGVVLGVDIRKDGKTPVIVPEEVLTRHTLLVGTTGSGKTTTVYRFIKHALATNKPLIFLDGKGDFGDIERFKSVCAKFGKKPHIITLDGDYGYNPFYTGTASELTDKIIAMTEWSEEHYKSSAERFIQLLIKFMQYENIKVTLPNIVKHCSIARLKKYISTSEPVKTNNNINTQADILDVISNETVEVHTGLKAESLELLDTIFELDKKSIDGIANRLGKIAESDSGKMLDADNGLILDEAIKKGEVVLFSLDSLRYQEKARAIGRLIITDIKTCVSSHQRRGGGRVSLIIDEFNIFVSHEVVDVINKSRSAGFEALLSFQGLSDIDTVQKGEPLRRQLIQNCNTIIAQLQNDPRDAEILADAFGFYEKVETTISAEFSQATGRESMRLQRRHKVSTDEIKELTTGQAFVKVGTEITKVAILKD